jgi:hypothetical protein
LTSFNFDYIFVFINSSLEQVKNKKMGKIKQGILGGFSGKVAGVVGSSWKGINVMRAMPISVANPRTTAQVEQRNKFSSAVYFAKKILSTAIKPLWDRWAVQMSGYNAFIARNIEFFGPDYLMEPENLIFSEGKMAKSEITSVIYNEASNSIMFWWDTSLIDSYQSDDDLVFAGVWVSEVKDKVDSKSSVNSRSSGSHEYFLPFSVSTNDIIHVWLAFKRPDGTVVSNSSHSTITIP